MSEATQVDVFAIFLWSITAIGTVIVWLAILFGLSRTRSLESYREGFNDGYLAGEKRWHYSPRSYLAMAEPGELAGHQQTIVAAMGSMVGAGERCG